MKKLVLILAVIFLSLIVFFQYKKYTRLNAPQQYDYAINPAIDINYHDQKMVADYYQLAYEIGSFARSQWFNYKIDVLYKDNESKESIEATAVYNQMRASVTEIEQRLLTSAKLKSKGYSNNDIQEIERLGIAPELYQVHKTFSTTRMQYGDEGDDILTVQRLLNKHGYHIKEDGIFNQETKETIIAFQQKNNLLDLGITNEQTLLKLLSTN